MQGCLVRVEDHLAVEGSGSVIDAGQEIDLLVRGQWIPVRMEHSKGLGWFAVIDQYPGDEALAVTLRPGHMARVRV